LTASGLSLRYGSQLLQALRMTVSSLAAFAVAQTLGLPQAFWAVITALIVTQSNVGGSLKAAFDRFLGSVFGAVYGSAIAFAIPHEHGLARAAALVAAVAPLSFLAAFSAGFRVAPITAIIVLLSATGANLGPFGFAADRVLEVGLGCAVGLLVSVLIVPARASRLVLARAARVAELLADQLETLAQTEEQGAAEMTALVVSTRQTLSRLETLVGEAARERSSRLADTPDPEPLFRTLMRLRHDVVMLRRAMREGGHAMRDPISQRWSHAAATGAAALRDVGRALPEGRIPQPLDAVTAAVSDYRTSLDEAARQQALPPDAAWRLFGAGFALDQFRRDLTDLRERAQEFASKGGKDVPG
jgi:uncharacterized membrane protein YccC